MKIIRAFPPMYAEINKKFNVRGKPVIFTWSDRIFNPSNVPIGPELMAHETVHSGQQGTEPEVWWSRYLIDVEFRLDQELPAHRAEFEACRSFYDGRALERMLHRIADRISSPLYGSMIAYDEARRAIASS
jgi:hypothetical protein